jgi:hypothetical protein
MTELEVYVMQPKGNYKRQRGSIKQRYGVSNRVLPDNTIVLEPDRVFQSESPSTPI